uniref:Solute carrier family 25 member 28 n=1 Tax=Cyprinus carpio carpio TaxID=630221 RepID=A0A8C1CEE3_CYPCA
MILEDWVLQMEADGFVRRRRMTADTSGGDAAVAGASAGAEIHWLGGRFWGVSESLVGTLTPRIAGETELHVGHFYGSQEANDSSEPDYEGLPQGASTSTHMLAGAVAGIMEHCLMFPIDCVKTRMQSLQPEPAARYRNVMDALWQIVRTEGIWRPIRGLNVTAVGAGPAHALYFACYERLKKVLSDIIHPGANSHLANGAAGCVATLLHDAAMNPAEGSRLISAGGRLRPCIDTCSHSPRLFPADRLTVGQTGVVKQRMQMYNSPYRGVLDCMRCVWQQEGALAFYRSYTTQLTMNIPFQALHFMTYEYLQELLNPQRHYNPSSHMVSGALAGAIAAAATTPLDVCKTLLNTQESLALDSVSQSGRHITGLGHAFRTIYRLGGLPAYFKGVQARVIYQMPSTAISWSVYEFFKNVITKHQQEKRRIQRDGEK